MVLIDTVYINNSGGKVLLDYLIRQIKERKLENLFYFLLDSRAEFENLDGISYEKMESSEFNRFKFYLNKRKLFSKVVCFGNVPPPFFLKQQVFIYFHNPMLDDSIFQSFSQKVKRIYIKLLVKKEYALVVQTDFMKSLAQNYFKTRQTLTFPFYTLPKSKTMVKANKPKQFVYISGGPKHKNHDVLLKAWLVLFKMGYNVPLHLTITNSFPILLSKIEELKREGLHIINHGHTDVNKLFDLCEFQIYPSLSETFGLGLVEAVNAGLKVIASDRRFVFDVIKPTLTFDPLSEDSIVSSVLEALKNDDLSNSEVTIENKIDDFLELIS